MFKLEKMHGKSLDVDEEFSDFRVSLLTDLLKKSGPHPLTK